MTAYLALIEDVQGLDESSPRASRGTMGSFGGSLDCRHGLCFSGGVVLRSRFPSCFVMPTPEPLLVAVDRSESRFIFFIVIHFVSCSLETEEAGPRPTLPRWYEVGSPMSYKWVRSSDGLVPCRRYPMDQLVISHQNSRLPPPYNSRGRSTDPGGSSAFLRGNNHGSEVRTRTQNKMALVLWVPMY